MTVQPTLFAAEVADTLRCWQCRQRTRHETLTRYPNGSRLVRCTQCNAGGTTT